MFRLALGISTCVCLSVIPCPYEDLGGVLIGVMLWICACFGVGEGEVDPVLGR